MTRSLVACPTRPSNGSPVRPLEHRISKPAAQQSRAACIRQAPEATAAALRRSRSRGLRPRAPEHVNALGASRYQPSATSRPLSTRPSPATASPTSVAPAQHWPHRRGAQLRPSTQCPLRRSSGCRLRCRRATRLTAPAHPYWTSKRWAARSGRVRRSWKSLRCCPRLRATDGPSRRRCRQCPDTGRCRHGRHHGARLGATRCEGADLQIGSPGQLIDPGFGAIDVPVTQPGQARSAFGS